MVTRLLVVLLLIICTSCQFGLIPCPTVKADRLKRSNGKKGFFSPPKMITASARENKATQTTKRYPRTQARVAPLEHVDVEEWDCPKPGTKRTMPKAVKDNIRKNRKAYEAYYRNHAAPDSTTSR